MLSITTKNLRTVWNVPGTPDFNVVRVAVRTSHTMVTCSLCNCCLISYANVKYFRKSCGKCEESGSDLYVLDGIGVQERPQ